ncbi:MAG: hypothetical protein GY750_16515 [Lentisphaerae bacterium]|nr:hypothetical protein [Lentisphaerota bacterium]MCP4103000.1 hypothetical protein [Lentisphaerota bacterium]
MFLQIGRHNPHLMNEIRYPIFIHKNIYFKGRKFSIKIEGIDKNFAAVKYKEEAWDIIDLNNKRKKVVQIHYESFYKLSPDCRKMAFRSLDSFISYSESVAVIDLLSKSNNVKTKQGFGMIFCWTSEGNLILEEYKNEEPNDNLFLFDVKTKKLTSFAKGESPSLAPKSGRVTYARNSKLFSNHPNELKGKYICDFHKSENRHFKMLYQLSPDEKFLLYTVCRYNTLYFSSRYIIIKKLSTGEEHILLCKNLPWLPTWLEPETAQYIIDNNL